MPLWARQVHVGRGSVAGAVEQLRPGEYVWEPEVAPRGPLLLVVSLATQRALLFRNGVPMGASTISSGRADFPTPTGVFSILQKKVDHHSSIDDGAPMPYMQRLTWSGIALHAGQLPGYPASHGCVRLPDGFARLLYRTTTMGMTVVITERAGIPRFAPDPALVPRQNAPAKPGGRMAWEPQRSPSGPVSVLVSAADGRAVVLRNGVEIGAAPVAFDRAITGTWVYALRRTGRRGQMWVKLDLSRPGDPANRVEMAEWQQFHAPEAFRRAVGGVLKPGATIIVTADSLVAGSTGAALTVLEGGGQEAP